MDDFFIIRPLFRLGHFASLLGYQPNYLHLGALGRKRRHYFFLLMVNKSHGAARGTIIPSKMGMAPCVMSQTSVVRVSHLEQTK